MKLEWTRDGGKDEIELTRPNVEMYNDYFSVKEAKKFTIRNILIMMTVIIIIMLWWLWISVEFLIKSHPLDEPSNYKLSDLTLKGKRTAVLAVPPGEDFIFQVKIYFFLFFFLIFSSQGDCA